MADPFEGINSPEHSELENSANFEKLTEELKASAETLHEHFKKKYVQDHINKYGKEPDLKLVLPSRYTYDNCANMNWDEGVDQIKLSIQPDEIYLAQGIFSPARLGYNNITDHYVDVAKKGDKYYGIDFAGAQFGKLDTEALARERKVHKDSKLLLFEADSLEDAIQTYDSIYGGQFEITTPETSHRNKPR